MEKEEKEMLWRHDERIENLERWQVRQNGSIQKTRDEISDVRSEVNDVRKWIMRATLGITLNLFGVTATAIFLVVQAGD